MSEEKQRGSGTTGGKRRSSLFQRARFSFVRSGGDRGASTDVLRGTSGADFEGEAKVVRGRGYDIGSCFGLFSCGQNVEQKEAKKVRYVLVKGSACFVFADENDPSPKYAVSLAYMRPIMSEHDKKTVLLETSLGDLEYKFVFTEQDDAEKFRKVVHKEAAQAECEIQRKRLGHENLISRSSSVKYAESVAQKKEKDCPEAPVDSAQILAGMQNTEVAQY